MKKILLSAAPLALAGALYAAPKPTAGMPSQAAIQVSAVADSTTKTPVNVQDLPDPVKATLKTDAYKDWTPAAASLVKSDSGSYYEINLTKGTDQKTVKIDATGKVVD